MASNATNVPIEPAAVTCTITAHRGVWAVTTDGCPYCNAKEHYHGGGDTTRPPTLGSRASHCLDSSVVGQYRLVPRHGTEY